MHDDYSHIQVVVMESGAAGRRTVETVQASERLIDALDIADREEERWREYNEVHLDQVD